MDELCCWQIFLLLFAFCSEIQFVGFGFDSDSNVNIFVTKLLLLLFIVSHFDAWNVRLCYFSAHCFDLIIILVTLDKYALLLSAQFSSVQFSWVRCVCACAQFTLIKMNRNNEIPLHSKLVDLKSSGTNRAKWGCCSKLKGGKKNIYLLQKNERKLQNRINSDVHVWRFQNAGFFTLFFFCDWCYILVDLIKRLKFDYTCKQFNNILLKFLASLSLSLTHTNWSHRFEHFNFNFKRFVFVWTLNPYLICACWTLKLGAELSLLLLMIWNNKQNKKKKKNNKKSRPKHN